MALNGVKNNKCFNPVVRCTGTVTISIPSNTSTPRSQFISDSSITAGDVAVTTPNYTDDAAAIQDGSIIYWTAILNGKAVVYMRATDGEEHEITFNVVVLAGASSE